ncbi:TPA: TraK family protein [Yersinia enterocolitica]
MTDTSSKTPRGHGRVAFLALVEDFRKLLDAGHPLRSIYDDHQERLGIGYPQFTKYVGRYIRKAKDDGHQRKGSTEQGQTAPQSHSPAPTGAAGSGDGSSTAPAAKPSSGAKRPVFQHDPSSGNNRKDLI